jgi:hypothetical protein
MIAYHCMEVPLFDQHRGYFPLQITIFFFTSYKNHFNLTLLNIKLNFIGIPYHYAEIYIYFHQNIFE